MDVKPDTLSDVRSYLFDYVTGILWLVAAAMMAGSSNWPQHVIEVLNATAKIPEFVVGFAVVIAGVVLPYCVSILVRPVTLRLMSILLKQQRSFERWKRKRSAAATTTKGKALDVLAAEQVMKRLSYSGDVNREIRLMYLYATNPSLALRIEKMRDDIWFHAAAVLPSALLLGSFGYRTVPVQPLAVGVFVTFVTFSFATWFTNREQAVWWDSLSVAVLMAAAPSRSACTKEVPSNTPLQPTSGGEIEVE